MLKEYFYSKTNQMHQCLKFILFWNNLYMFLTVFPSVIRSSRLHVQQQAFVKQILLLPGSSSWWWTERPPKHVELFQNKINLRHWRIWMETIEIYYDARSCERQMLMEVLLQVTEKPQNKITHVATHAQAHIRRWRAAALYRPFTQ